MEIGTKNIFHSTREYSLRLKIIVSGLSLFVICFLLFPDSTLFSDQLLTFLIPILPLIGAINVVEDPPWREDGKPKGSAIESFIGHSPLPMIATDPFGTIDIVNEAFISWTGSSRDQLHGQKMFDVLNFGGKEKLTLVSLTKHSNQGMQWNGQVEVLRRDGKMIPSLFLFTPMHDTAGTLIRYIGVFSDLTDQRKWEQRNQEAQQRYQHISETLRDGLIVVMDEKVLSANKMMARLYGYSNVSDLIGKRLSDLFVPETLRQLHPLLREDVFGHTPLARCEAQGLHRDGRVLDLEINGGAIRWEGRHAAQFTVRDVTDRKVFEYEEAEWFWEVETLGVIDKNLAMLVSLAQVIDAVSQYGQALTRSDWSAVMLHEHLFPSCRLHSIRGGTSEDRHLVLESGLFYEKLKKNQKPIILNDLHVQRAEMGSLGLYLERERIISATFLPLQIENQTRGHIVVGYRARRRLSSRLLRVVTTFVERSAIAIRSSELYENLKKHERELQMLVGARVQAQEEERQRISREIHDGLGQILTAVKLNVELLSDKAVFDEAGKKQFEDVKQLLENAITEARELSHKLRPSVLDDFGLLPSIQLLCEENSRRTKTEILFSHFGDITRLDPQIETNLYRIVQEAITNVVKYANADTLTIQLMGMEQMVRLTIEDDGRGFDQDETAMNIDGRPRMGLLSMHERVRILHGTISIDSYPGRGTTITVEIPILGGKKYEES